MLLNQESQTAWSEGGKTNTHGVNGVAPGDAALESGIRKNDAGYLEQSLGKEARTGRGSRLKKGGLTEGGR